MADYATRRARDYRKRAAQLTDMATHSRDAEDRRHLLDLAEGYASTSDQTEPTVELAKLACAFSGRAVQTQPAIANKFSTPARPPQPQKSMSYYLHNQFADGIG